MSGSGTCVFVVDDDLAMRESLESLLRSVGHQVQSFASPQEFRGAGCADLPCCMVLDVRLPEMSGLEFQRELARQHNAIPIVFITGHGDIPMSVAAMKAGAVEFLTKPFREQDLLDAVHRALQRDQERRALHDGLAELRRRYASLTPRERDVLQWVVAGHPNKRIAGELGLSEVTVKVHRGNVMRKMEARSLPELVRHADRLLAHGPEDSGPDTKV